jgi:transposase
MEAQIERCCGLDVHQASIVACVLSGLAGQKPTKEVRTFGTCLTDLEELRDWLRSLGVTHVGMESTGIYWRPVYAQLEDGFVLVVGNAFHMKNIPGRKTDVKDAEWIADLLRHGLIRPSFIPPRPVRELRDLMRYRRKLIESRSDERNRLLKVLETANIKLSSVVTNAFGVSGMSMLEALARGETDGAVMAELARRRMRSKREQLRKALTGRVADHHRFMLQVQIRRMREVERDLRVVDEEVEKRMREHEAQLASLQAIPGIGLLTARIIISELGTDLSAFRDEHQLAAWTGLVPGNNESAGKRLGGQLRKGNQSLKGALVEAAIAAIRTKGSYVRSKYYRLKARMGGNRAKVAIAHKLLIAVFHVLARGAPYRELGEVYLDRVNQERTARHLVRRLEKLGYQVNLAPAA